MQKRQGFILVVLAVVTFIWLTLQHIGGFSVLNSAVTAISGSALALKGPRIEYSEPFCLSSEKLGRIVTSEGQRQRF